MELVEVTTYDMLNGEYAGEVKGKEQGNLSVFCLESG